MSSARKEVVRDAQGSGKWFPGNRTVLKTMVNDFIGNAATPAVTGRILAVISPHAGYVFSGPIAGSAFKAVAADAATSNAPETVVVVGFCHGLSFPGMALMDGSTFRSPMSETPLDEEAGALLEQADHRIFFDYRPHQGEHSAENQIPFVQAALPSAKLVVGLMGGHDPATIDAVVKGLAALAAKKRILVVASTDLLHDYDCELVASTDSATLASMTALDDKTLAASWSPNSQVCCGIGPVISTIRFARAMGCKRGIVTGKGTSADGRDTRKGDYVVGYGAVVFPTDEAAK